jgi:hypothetical protein
MGKWTLGRLLKEFEPKKNENTPLRIIEARTRLIFRREQRNKMNNSSSFKTVLGFNGFFSAEDVGMVVTVDARAAFLGLVEVLKRQTADERASKGTRHKNRFGFSKREVTLGTALATKFLNDEELSMEDIETACRIAYRYRKQLLMIALGAVPENNLNLRNFGG